MSTHTTDIVCTANYTVSVVTCIMENGMYQLSIKPLTHIDTHTHMNNGLKILQNTDKVPTVCSCFRKINSEFVLNQNKTKPAPQNTPVLPFVKYGNGVKALWLGHRSNAVLLLLHCHHSLH